MDLLKWIPFQINLHRYSGYDADNNWMSVPTTLPVQWEKKKIKKLAFWVWTFLRHLCLFVAEFRRFKQNHFIFCYSVTFAILLELQPQLCLLQCSAWEEWMSWVTLSVIVLVGVLYWIYVSLVSATYPLIFQWNRGLVAEQRSIECHVIHSPLGTPENSRICSYAQCNITKYNYPH